MSALEAVKSQLHPGQVYRRSDLEKWSKTVDRHLQQLLKDGQLTKLAGGLYYAPKQTTFGAAPADDPALVQAFLKDRRFLLFSPNAYNALGVGTTQLYNQTVVYNHKRHGRFKLGGRVFDFRMKPHFPLKPNREFLLVDLVNNVTRLAEDREKVLSHVREKALQLDPRALRRAVEDYGGARAKKFFAAVLDSVTVGHAA